MHGRWQETDFLCKFFANGLDAFEQIAVLLVVHQGDQAVTHFKRNGVDGHQVVPSGFLCFGGGGLDFGLVVSGGHHFLYVAFLGKVI